MTFGPIQVGGFSLGQTFTHGNANAINTDLQNALDKTGDNAGTTPPGGISGEIEVLSGGSIVVDSGANLTVNGTETVGGTLNMTNVANVASTCTLNVNGTTMANGTISVNQYGLVNIASGGGLTTTSGCYVYASLGTNAYLISTYGSNTAGISMPTAQRYAVGGTGEAIKQVVPLYFKDAIYNGGFTSGGSNGGNLVGGGSGTSIYIGLGTLHAGATLTSIELITGTTASNDAGTNATFALYVKTLVTGSGAGSLSGLGGGWTSSGAILNYGTNHLTSYSISGTAQVIPSATYSTAGTQGIGAQYALYISDDGNSAGTNTYYYAILHYTVSSLQWP